MQPLSESQDHLVPDRADEVEDVLTSLSSMEPFSFASSSDLNLPVNVKMLVRFTLRRRRTKLERYELISMQ